MTDARGKRLRATSKHKRERQRLYDWLDSRCRSTWGLTLFDVASKMRAEVLASGCNCCGDYTSTHLGTLIRAYGFLGTGAT